MAQSRLTWRTLGWPVYLALGLFVLVIVVFGITLATLQSSPVPTVEPISTSEAASRTVEAMVSNPDSERVAALLAMGTAVDGASVINQYGCHVCHTTQVTGVG